MPSHLRITVLVENTAHGAGTMGEHGLAYWIEWDDHRALFDTGQGFVLVNNAHKLGVSIRNPEAIILSHGHYDHTGGLAAMLRDAASAEVHVHPAAFAPKYARNRDGTSRSIGLPLPAQQALEGLGQRVVHTESPTVVLGRLTVTGEVPRTHAFEDTGGAFFLDAECTAPDPLADDQSLFFDTPQGTVVLLGCAHAGVSNTLRYIFALTGGRPIHAVIGGMHLAGASPERMCQTVEVLQQLDVARLAPCHCTGLAATVALWNALPGRCEACHVGTRFEFQLR